MRFFQAYIWWWVRLSLSVGLNFGGWFTMAVARYLTQRWTTIDYFSKRSHFFLLYSKLIFSFYKNIGLLLKFLKILLLCLFLTNQLIFVLILIFYLLVLILRLCKRVNFFSMFYRILLLKNVNKLNDLVNQFH